MTVRDSRPEDVNRIAEIYGFYVRGTTSSFEIEPPSVDELMRRREAVRQCGLPHLVGEVAGRVVSFAYAAPYRTRPAYQYTVENSLYVAPDCLRRGLGRELLNELIGRCGAAGWRQMVAVIGDSGNEGSIRLHTALGFRRVGQLDAVGWKLNRWVDIVIMQRALGHGSERAPEKPL